MYSVGYSVWPKPGFGIGNLNQVLVSGTETMVQFWYQYRSRKYRPMWVSVSDLNQNSGFGRTTVGIP